jgi:hypothetical protein
MVIRLGGVFTLIAVVAWLYAIFDALTAPADRIRNLPKAIWLIIILLLVDLGAIAWFIWGRPRASVKARTPRSPFGWQGHGDAASGAPRRSIAPDDDPEFLRRLNDDLRRGGDTRRDGDTGRDGRDGDDPVA